MLVTYVFGPRLPASGRCITKKDELRKLAKRPGEFAGYVVEVCPDCSWNHLARTFVLSPARTVAAGRTDPPRLGPVRTTRVVHAAEPRLRGPPCARPMAEPPAPEPVPADRRSPRDEDTRPGAAAQAQPHLAVPTGPAPRRAHRRHQRQRRRVRDLGVPVQLPHKDPPLLQTSFICAADVTDGCNEDNSIAQLSGGVDRVTVTYDRSRHLRAGALLAAEDKDFFKHDGIDPVGIGRAALHDIHSDTVQQGGSTITQQYVKNVYLTNELTFERKLKEAVLAIKLDQELPKQEILERYLNTIYFGRGAYGIEAAARATSASTSPSSTCPSRRTSPGSSATRAGPATPPSPRHCGASCSATCSTTT